VRYELEFECHLFQLHVSKDSELSVHQTRYIASRACVISAYIGKDMEGIDQDVI